MSKRFLKIPIEARENVIKHSIALADDVWIEEVSQLIPQIEVNHHKTPQEVLGLALESEDSVFHFILRPTFCDDESHYDVGVRVPYFNVEYFLHIRLNLVHGADLIKKFNLQPIK